MCVIVYKLLLAINLFTKRNITHFTSGIYDCFIHDSFAYLFDYYSIKYIGYLKENTM